MYREETKEMPRRNIDRKPAELIAVVKASHDLYEIYIILKCADAPAAPLGASLRILKFAPDESRSISPF